MSSIWRRGGPDYTDAIVLDVDEYEELMGAVRPVRLVSDGPSIREGSSRRNSRAKADGISTALPRRETQEQQQPNNLHSSGAAKSRKPKNPQSVVPVVDTQKPKPIPAAKPNKIITVLPIKAWYLGRKFFYGPYHLVWYANAKITIRSGDSLTVPVKHSEEIDIGIVAERVLFVSPEVPADDKVFCLKTIGKFPKKMVGNWKPIGTQFPSYFKQGGSHGEGDIVIKFDSASPAWADAVYERFIWWVKGNVQERERLTAEAGQSKWEGARRSAELTESRHKREADGGPSGFPKVIGVKSLAVPGIPPLDTRSPPAAIPHKRQNTEEGPPAKRQKKMQDKGVQVGSSSDQHAMRSNVQEKFKGVQVGLGIGWSVGLVRLDNTAAW